MPRAWPMLHCQPAAQMALPLRCGCLLDLPQPCRVNGFFAAHPAPLVWQALNEVITSIAHGAAAAGSAGTMSEGQQAEVLQLLLGAAGETEEECRSGGCMRRWAGLLVGRNGAWVGVVSAAAQGSSCCQAGLLAAVEQQHLPYQLPPYPPPPPCCSVVAECLGSLALLNGQLVLPALRSNLSSPSGAPG